MPIVIIYQEGRKMSHCRRKYTLWNLFWDCVLTAFTGGFYLIWIFVRESRLRNG